LNEAKQVPEKGEAELFKSRYSIGTAEDHGQMPGFAVGAISFRFYGVQDALEGTMLDLGIECE
jgi:hypothetical protein